MMMAMLLPPPIQTTLLLLVLLLTGYKPADSFALNLYRCTVRCHCPSSSRHTLLSPTKQRHIIRHVPVKSAITAEANNIITEQQDTKINSLSSPPPSSSSSSDKLCYYKRIDGSWKPRKELKNLKIGERLFATRLPDRDLLDGKTGPKAFLECGIGRRNNQGKWSIVNGMIRLGKRGTKTSITRKRLQKNMPPELLIEVYVSKIRLEEGTLEVCLNREEALEIGDSIEQRRKTSASKLRIGDELHGIVRNATPYGVFVDVNANRNGLLHISKVAKQQDAYVAKEDGLKALGLGRGSPINVIVVSNERKRLELDLAPRATPAVVAGESPSIDEDFVKSNNSIEQGYNEISDEEAAMWAAYAIDSTEDDDNEYNEEDEEYDEDTDIEDALGIGYY